MTAGSVESRTIGNVLAVAKRDASSVMSAAPSRPT